MLPTYQKRWRAFCLLGILCAALPGGATCARGDDAFREWAEQDREELRNFQVAPAGTKQAVPLTGVYTVKGTDSTWGAYTGELEVRSPDDGSGLVVISTRLYASARFEGDRIALAWQGVVRSASEPYLFDVELEQSGFITRYKQWSRPGQVMEPLLLKGEFTRHAPQVLQGEFKANGQSRPMFSETWTRVSGNGPQPIWRNMRQVMPAHREPTKKERTALFASLVSYHALPALQPYKDRPEFKRAVHGFVFDPTDYEFYRGHPDVLRVIQKVLDPISFVETRIRNRAYRQRLADKAEYFDKEMPLHFLNDLGMIEHVNRTAPAGQQQVPDVDGMAWTGDYVMAQAIRYLVTEEPVALDNMLRSLRGMILCYDIAPEKGAFARTVRTHEAGASASEGGWTWVRGEGEYEAYDWLAGCNNDMLKGYWNSFLWATIVLSKQEDHADIRQSMARIVDELIASNPDASDGGPNQAYAHLLLYTLTNNLLEYGKYTAMFIYLKPWLVDFGNGSAYEFGVTDWSGNYMHVKTLVNLYILEKHLATRGTKGKHIDDYRRALTKGLERMRHTRLGFFQLASAALGDFREPPPELEDALWVMREFAAPKVTHDLDWRINREFCLSPMPNLPWKMDWASQDRTLSLTCYPLFERNPSNVQWKEIPNVYRGWVGSVDLSGVDFLSAYWLGRYCGAIDGDM